MNPDTWAIVAATFLGPIFAVGLTLWRESASRKYQRRLHVFRTLMATRKQGISPDHVNSLNLVEVDFYKCKEVERAWKSYLEHLNNSGRPEDDAWRKTRDERLAELLFQIGVVLKIEIPALDIYKGGYVPMGWAHKDSRSNEVLDYFHDMAAGTKVFPIWLKGVTPPDQQGVAPPPVQPAE